MPTAGLTLEKDSVDNTLKRIAVLRKDVLVLKRNIASKKEMVGSLSFRANGAPFIRHEIQVYMRDIHDELVVMQERADLSWDLLNVMHTCAACMCT